MLFLLILFFFLYFFFLVRKCVDGFSKMVLIIYGAFWTVSLIGTQFNIQGLHTPQDTTLLICVLGIICFSVGFFSVPISSTVLVRYNANLLKQSIENLISNKIFQIIVYVATIYIISQDILLINAIFVDKVLIGGDARVAIWDEDSLYNPILRFLIPNFFSWLIPIVKGLFCYSLFYKRDRFTIVMLLLLFGFTALDVGRIGFIKAILPLIAVIGLFQIYKGRIYLLKAQKKLFLAIMSLAFVFVFVVSTIRNASSDFTSAMSDGWNATIEQVVSYSIGPTVAFDHQINSNAFHNFVGEDGRGSISLWPLMTPYFRLQTPYIGIKPNFDKFREFTEKEKIDVGIYYNWNGLYTWNLNFYSDGGILGIILLNFLFGFFMRYTIKLTYRHQTVYSYILCTIVLMYVILSPMKLIDYNVIDPIFISVLLILSYKNRISNLMLAK